MSDNTKAPNNSSLKFDETWLNHAEAAAYLRLPEKSLYNLCSNGHIPYYKLSARRNRYLLEDLKKLSLSNRQGGYDGDN